jgi:hypothetical protein
MPTSPTCRLISARAGASTAHPAGAFRNYEVGGADQAHDRTAALSRPADVPIRLRVAALVRPLDQGHRQRDHAQARSACSSTGRAMESPQWPLPETRWTPFYLHEGGLLSGMNSGRRRRLRPSRIRRSSAAVSRSRPRNSSRRPRSAGRSCSRSMARPRRPTFSGSCRSSRYPPAARSGC